MLPLVDISRQTRHSAGDWADSSDVVNDAVIESENTISSNVNKCASQSHSPG
jgi:hypothetical protein